MTNLEFVRSMEDVDAEGTYRASAYERWVRVRWINIAGLSWDVVKAVAVRYNLHHSPSKTYSTPGLKQGRKRITISSICF
ncbi:hypothetical protein C8J56DRAFT_921496 [Mycena floridula]|nr:hypothetical protein C8J56DRAFT_921496 [Mycena floridula]